MIGKAALLGAALLAACSTLVEEPEPVGTINPVRLELGVKTDTVVSTPSGSPIGSISAFPSEAYFEQDSTLHFSPGRDTLTFAYKSFDDMVHSNGISDVDFRLTRAASGDYELRGDAIAHFNDVGRIGKEWKHSLNAGAAKPGGFPKGRYHVEIRVREACYCFPQPPATVFTGIFVLQ